MMSMLNGNKFKEHFHSSECTLISWELGMYSIVLCSSQFFVGQTTTIISPNTESAVVALGIANSICLQNCAIHFEVLSLWGSFWYWIPGGLIARVVGVE